MKKQFEMLLSWKEKVRESNKKNLLKFEQLRSQICLLKDENEKYRQCLQDPEKKVRVQLSKQAYTLVPIWNFQQLL